MALWSGNALRQRRHRAGVALDAIAWLLGLTFIEVVQDIEQSIVVSQQVSDDYLAAVDLLRPMSETMRRHYGTKGEDPAEENMRLRGYHDARPERAGLRQ